MKFLKQHPFSVKAHFDQSLVLTFAVPKSEVQQYIPECLSLDTFQDKWAFIAIAMVQTSHLRPSIFPKFVGNNFFLIGYRFFVRYRNRAGKNLRGLYIIKSETNKKKMEYLGSIFTNYNYSTTDIEQKFDNNIKTIESKKSDFKVTFDLSKQDVAIPVDSPFENWKDARKFAGPLPHTFTYDADNQNVLIIQGLRQNWKPLPVQVDNYHFEFLNQLKLNNVVLASAFKVEDIPYQWQKGRIEKWEKS